MRCKKCNRPIRHHKEQLESYGFCLRHLPSEHRCIAKTKKGTRCKLPIVENDRCEIHTSWGKPYYCEVENCNKLAKYGKWCKQHRITNQFKEDWQKEGYVYVFDLGIDGLYKIGMGTSWRRRLKTFAVANPRIQMVLAKKVYNMSWAERECHLMMQDNRTTNELFYLTANDIEKLDAFLSAPSTQYGQG